MIFKQPIRRNDWSAEEMIAHADTYMLAFEIINSSNLPITTSNYAGKDLRKTAVIPAIIYLIFAAALYIKAILIKQDEKYKKDKCIRSHNLLFDQLRYGFEWNNIVISVSFLNELTTAARFVAHLESSDLTRHEKMAAYLYNQTRLYR